jgi:hypothetical protein
MRNKSMLLTSASRSRSISRSSRRSSSPSCGQSMTPPEACGREADLTSVIQETSLVATTSPEVPVHNTDDAKMQRPSKFAEVPESFCRARQVRSYTGSLAGKIAQSLRKSCQSLLPSCWLALAVQRVCNPCCPQNPKWYYIKFYGSQSQPLRIAQTSLCPLPCALHPSNISSAATTSKEIGSPHTAPPTSHSLPSFSAA